MIILLQDYIVLSFTTQKISITILKSYVCFILMKSTFLRGWLPILIRFFIWHPLYLLNIFIDDLLLDWRWNFYNSSSYGNASSQVNCFIWRPQCFICDDSKLNPVSFSERMLTFFWKNANVLLKWCSIFLLFRLPSPLMPNI